MFEIVTVAGMLAGALSLVAFIPYILAIRRRETVPNRATWFIWMIVGLMLGSSYYSSGASHTIWVPVSYIIGPFAIFLFSLKYGEKGWTRLDSWCLAGTGGSLILWLIFKSPLIALVINLLIDAFGALPTIRKSYYAPESEDRLAWTLFFLGNVLNLFAVECWSFSIAAYPIYMFLGSGIIVLLIFLRPRSRQAA